jgi:hypothetical protein
VKKLFLFLLALGAAGYFVYTTYIQGHPGASSSKAGTGMQRMRGNSKEMDEVTR